MKKPTQAQQDKTRAERSALIAASQDAKAFREMMIATANTEEKMLMALSLSINDLLIMAYEQATSCKEFRTFYDWKAEGFKVKKGEKAFRIWGRPIKAKNAKEDDENPKDEGDEESGYKLWPMCCLFNESQVEPLTPDQQPDEQPLDEPLTPVETSASSEKIPAPVVVAQVAAEPVDISNSPFVMQDFQERQEARRERLEERAERKRVESDQQYKRSHSLVENIPFGQPILVGHHSERGHRRALDKSWSAMGKSVALDDYAEKLERRAASVGCTGISSNDPEALTKLTEKLESLQRNQEAMKAANKAIKSGNDQALRDLDFKDAQIAELKTPDFAGRVGFANYSLQNNNAEIRRTRQRIEDLKRLHTSQPVNFSNDDFSLSVENGQVRFEFTNGKPAEGVRDMLKSRAFKWSRFSSAWVRKATPNAVCVAETLCMELQRVGDVY